MNITIINGSHRLEGNCAKFVAAAKSIFESNYHAVMIFNLINLDIKLCTGCLLCEDGKECLLHDDFSMLIEPALKESDIIIMATPTYFNMPSAAMVNYIDRTNKMCDYFLENHKKCLFYLVGQTDVETIREAYNCLHSFGEIMEMEEISEPIIQVARMPEEVSYNVLNILKKI